MISILQIMQFSSWGLQSKIKQLSKTRVLTLFVSPSSPALYENVSPSMSRVIRYKPLATQPIHTCNRWSVAANGPLNGGIVVPMGGRSDSSSPASGYNGILKAWNNLTKCMGFVNTDYHRSATQQTDKAINPPPTTPWLKCHCFPKCDRTPGYTEF